MVAAIIWSAKILIVRLNFAGSVWDLGNHMEHRGKCLYIFPYILFNFIAYLSLFQVQL